MNHLAAYTFWNPWWSGQAGWLQAVERDVMAELLPLLQRPEILIVTGVRRSGKTTILHLLIQKLQDEGVPSRNILHLNLEDPAFSGLSLSFLYEKYLELMTPEGKVYLFLDEVQEVEGWQRDLRKLYDGPQRIKCIVTGSNSSLLRGEYATLLTGRTLTCEVFPFSFREFLMVRGWNDGFDQHLLLARKPLLLNLFAEYLRRGGFPEVVREPDQRIKSLLLKEYYSAILTRDVLRRYPLRHAARHEAAAHYLVSNVTSLFSAKSLAPTLNINPHTLEEYLGYLEDVYLFFCLKHFSYSVKQQITYPRKVYSVDNGMIDAVAFRFSEDQGRMLENLVMVELKRRGKECYYWKGKKECDFVVMERGRVTVAIQVCHTLESPQTRKREQEGVREAMREFSLSSGLILTYDEADTITVDEGTVNIVPVWWWLCREIE